MKNHKKNPKTISGGFFTLRFFFDLGFLVPTLLIWHLKQRTIKEYLLEEGRAAGLEVRGRGPEPPRHGPRGGRAREVSQGQGLL